MPSPKPLDFGTGTPDQPKKDKKKGGLLSHLPGKKSLASAGMSVLNVLDKPGQAVRTGLRTVGEDSYKGKDPLHAVLHGVEKAGEGLIGKDRTTGTEALSAMTTGRKDTIKKLPFGVETAVDVATDPTSYVSFGATAKAKQALGIAAKELGEQSAKDIATVGVRKALTADGKAKLRQALVDHALTEGKGAVTAEKAAKIADKQFTALKHSGRGGLKVAGLSVPGLGAESEVGRAAAAVSPKKLVREALQGSEAGRAVRKAFIPGAELADDPSIGADIAGEVRGRILKHGDLTQVGQSEVDSAARNLTKAAKPTEDDLAVVRGALDVDPVTRAKRLEVDAAIHEADKQARSLARQAETSGARHSAVSDAIRKHLVDLRTTLEDAKQSLAESASKYGTSDFDHTAVAEQVKAVDKAQKELERTAKKYADSSTRQGVAQMASIDADRAAHAARDVEAARTARTGIKSTQTEDTIRSLRAEGKNPLADLVEFASKTREGAKGTSGQVEQGLLHQGTHATEEYLPHYTTKAGAKALKRLNDATEISLGTGRKFAAGELKGAIKQGEANIRKLFPGMTIDEINNEAVMSGLVKKGEKLFDDNPIALTVKRSHNAVAAIEHAKLVDEIAQMTDKNGAPLLREVTGAAPEGSAVLDLSEATGKKFVGPPSVVHTLNEVKAITTNEDALLLMQNRLHEVGKLWRSMATFGPAFHMRNAAGNFWLNYLAGVRNPADYAHALRLQKAVGAAFRTLGTDADIHAAIDGLKLKDTDKALLREALDEGVITRGFFHEDLSHGAPHLGGARTRKQKLGLLVSKPNDANRALGSVVENNARLAHFINMTDKLGSTKEAAQSVKKFLFDYSDLTKFEEHVKNNPIGIPFYTFMRKNTPLELEQILANPGKFTKVLHLSQDLREHGVTEQPDLPISSLEDTLRPITGSSTPGNKTASGLQRRFQGLLGPVAPGPKTLGDLASGSSSYNGYPLRSTKALELDALRNLAPVYGKLSGFKKKSLLRSILGFDSNPDAVEKASGGGGGSPKPLSFK